MSNAGFLLIAVAGIVAGSFAVWALNRKPKTFMSSIDDFQREMKAVGRLGTTIPGGAGSVRILTVLGLAIFRAPPAGAARRVINGPGTGPGRSRGAAAIARDLAIDLGTPTPWSTRGEGIVLNEPR